MKDYEVQSVISDPTSKWHFLPESSQTFAEAMRHAMSIAKQFASENDPPGIRIIGPDCSSDPWSVKALIEASTIAAMEKGGDKTWAGDKFLDGRPQLDQT